MELTWNPICVYNGLSMQLTLNPIYGFNGESVFQWNCHCILFVGIMLESVFQWN